MVCLNTYNICNVKILIFQISSTMPVNCLLNLHSHPCPSSWELLPILMPFRLQLCHKHHTVYDWLVITCAIMPGSHRICEFMTTSLALDTSCNLLFNDSTFPIPLINGYMALNPCSHATTTLGFSTGWIVLRYWTIVPRTSCNLSGILFQSFLC